MTALAPITLADGGGAEPIRYRVLPGDEPGNQRYLRNVEVATLSRHLPEPSVATKSAIIVAPGGALHFLSIDNEGAEVADALANHGIAAFVLHYRVEPTPSAEEDYFAYHMHHLSMSEESRSDRAFLAEVSRRRRQPAAEDGAAAVRHVRDNAADYGVDPDKVGLMGFSAGGFLTLVTAIDAPAASRPSFIAPIYPAMWGPIEAPNPTPPMFLAWAEDDVLGDVIIGSSTDAWNAWRAAGGSAEVHAYAGGGHGFGMSRRGTPSDGWLEDFLAWHAYIIR